MKSNYLAEEKIGKLLLKFSIPTILALLVSSLYNIVDQMFIGRGVGYLGNGATNVIFPITIIAIGLSLFIGDGGAALLSISSGRKDYSKGKKIVGNVVTAVIVSSILLVGACVLFPEKILWAFGATEGNIGYAREYLKYIIIGIPFFMFTTAVNSIIRADGSPQYSMVSMFVGAIINVVLDAIFIFVFDWGMMGAGLATSIGQIVSACISGYYLTRMNIGKLEKENFIPSKIVGEFLPLGISSLLTQLAIMTGMIAMNKSLVSYGAMSKYGSDIPLTIMGIVMKMLQIALAIIIGVAVGAQPIVGFNLGAQKYDRVKETYKLMLITEIVVGIIATIYFQLFPRQILGMFGSGDALYMEFGIMAFRVYLSLILLCAIQKSSAIFLQALGRPVLSMTLSLSRDFVLLVPLILIFARVFGVEGALYSAPIADVVSFIVTAFMMIFALRSIDKKNINNKKEQPVSVPS